MRGTRQCYVKPYQLWQPLQSWYPLPPDRHWLFVMSQNANTLYYHGQLQMLAFSPTRIGHYTMGSGQSIEALPPGFISVSIDCMDKEYAVQDLCQHLHPN